MIVAVEFSRLFINQQGVFDFEMIYRHDLTMRSAG